MAKLRVVPEVMAEGVANQAAAIDAPPQAGVTQADVTDPSPVTAEGEAVVYVKRSGGPDVRFTGLRLAEVKSHPTQGKQGFSGDVRRWKELRLYRATKADRYVLEIVEWHKNNGSASAFARHSVTIFKDRESMLQPFRDSGGWMIKELFTQAGIDWIQDLD